MDAQQEITLKSMLRRCRLCALAAATQAPKSLDDPGAELLPLLGQVAALARRTEDGRRWFVREVEALRAEMEALVDERRPYWRNKPPAWATALLLRPSVALQLLEEESVE